MRGSSYNRLERWLHWLALEPQPVRELSFDLARRFSTHRAAAEGAVYVCGLARSGTTVVLRALARSDALCSLTYRDMPFVLAPNLWRQLSAVGDRSATPAERAHGDGIMVDFDSPEAFEEVFWRTYCPQTPASKCYGDCDPTAEVMAAFAEYRALVAGEKRYLSKNNNNVVRLRALAQHGGGTIVVVYRRPLDAARSLHRQHQRFSAAQAEEPFTRSYMSWLGHHEFGLDHKPFCMARTRMRDGLSPDEPDYWLEYWAAVHEHVLAESAGLRLIDYDALCERPEAGMRSLLDALDIDGDAAALSNEIRVIGSTTSTAGFDPGIVQRASAAHAALRDNVNNISS